MLAASRKRLQRIVPDDAARVIQAAREVQLASMCAAIDDRPLLNRMGLVYDYLRAELGEATSERVVMLCLDARSKLLCCETVGFGSVSQAEIWIREIVRRCLDFGASGLILAHNHPSGDPTPSDADRLRTQELTSAARLFDITFHDHIIVARHRVVSFRALGMI